jgi:hypothetical protein
VIKGLHIPEERLLASALYLTGATTALLLLVTPGVSGWACPSPRR